MLSRRRFLHLMGVTVSAAALPRLVALPLEAAPSLEPVYGRALDALPLYDVPDGQPVAHLWSDTVAPILDVDDTWYRLPAGFARREGLQPMTAPARRSSAATPPPFWGSVSGAVAVVRAHCAARAPIVTRIGHGGVLRVIDLLAENGLAWYGVAAAEDAGLLGWTLAADWSPVMPDDALPRLTLALDPPGQRLTVLDGAQPLLTAPVSTGRSLLPGSYPVTDRQLAASQGDYRGVPWLLRFGPDFTLTGVYWHNRFGSATPGAAVQVAPPLAQWLYPRAAEIIVY